ncbi:Uncharacterised protein [uncultured archaeon]|nr:Uncharacterised protein [uncultured archaeon]
MLGKNKKRNNKLKKKVGKVKMKKQKKSNKITKKMSFLEIIEKNPDAAEVLFNRGMHCIGCGMARIENLEEGALAHGLDPDEIVNEINKKSKNISKKKKNTKKKKGRK